MEACASRWRGWNWWGGLSTGAVVLGLVLNFANSHRWIVGEWALDRPETSYIGKAPSSGEFDCILRVSGPSGRLPYDTLPLRGQLTTRLLQGGKLTELAAYHFQSVRLASSTGGASGTYQLASVALTSGNTYRFDLHLENLPPPVLAMKPTVRVDRWTPSRDAVFLYAGLLVYGGLISAGLLVMCHRLSRTI